MEEGKSTKPRLGSFEPTIPLVPAHCCSFLLGTRVMDRAGRSTNNEWMDGWMDASYGKRGLTVVFEPPGHLFLSIEHHETGTFQNISCRKPEDSW